MKKKDNELIRRGDVTRVFESWVANEPLWSRDLCDALQSIPAAQPRITAEDVVEGTRWHDGMRWHSVYKCLQNDIQVGSIVGRGWFSKNAVAAMLNVAEEVTFPEGHRLNPKPRTLEEVVREFVVLAEMHPCNKVPSNARELLDEMSAMVKPEVKE